MKGVTFLALKGMVVDRYGEDLWNEVLKAAGFPEEPIVLATANFEDTELKQIFSALPRVLKVSLQQVYDDFGDYWVNEYAPRIYGAHYAGVDDTRSFLLRMNKVHEMVTRNVPGSNPPKFEYEWKDDKTLVMTYISDRGLIDLMVGLIKGVGKHYNEKPTVRKLNNDKVEIVFP